MIFAPKKQSMIRFYISSKLKYNRKTQRDHVPLSRATYVPAILAEG